MDSQVRSMTTDLINLSEEYRFDPVQEIIKGISQTRKGEPQGKPTELQPKFIRKLNILFEPVSKLLGFNVIGFWGFITVLNIIVWTSYVRSAKISINYFVKLSKTYHENQCIVPNYEQLMDVGRPTFNCDKCKGLTEVKQVTNLTKEEFLKMHAYTAVPVLVKGGIKHWKAVETFGFEWFKSLYAKNKAFPEQNKNGQFFGYKTNFADLREALTMNKARKNKTWYFGWNNVHTEVAAVLRQHYSRPEFLPDKSESSQIDWIFMGKAGPGAQVHIDSVGRPSWQAQVKGKKTWSLFPSVECQSVCNPINGTMETGDIIVVDTNQWYHSTHIWPGEISITIGSEYD